MTREELDWCWSQQEPIEGVTFMLTDPVRLTGGSRRGQLGSTIALQQLEPEPTYLVALDSGDDLAVPQSHLCSALVEAPRSNLAELQHWYATQTNGDREHSYGIRIATLDNPGWSLDVDLEDTPLAGQLFEELVDLEPTRDWMICRVKEGRFEARGGPFMLDRMLGTFAAWARSAQPSAPDRGAAGDVRQGIAPT